MSLPQPPVGEKPLSPSQLSKRFPITASKIRRWIRQGRLPAVDTSDGDQPRWLAYPTHLRAVLNRGWNLAGYTV